MRAEKYSTRFLPQTNGYAGHWGSGGEVTIRRKTDSFLKGLMSGKGAHIKAFKPNCVTLV